MIYFLLHPHVFNLQAFIEAIKRKIHVSGNKVEFIVKTKQVFQIPI